MPVSFLTDEQVRRYARFAGEPAPDLLAWHFHLDDADLAFVREHRGEHNRLGVAVQLETLRCIGAFLEAPASPPPLVARYVGEQLAIADPAAAQRRARRLQHRLVNAGKHEPPRHRACAVVFKCHLIAVVHEPRHLAAAAQLEQPALWIIHELGTR
jgi:hypothetical protein